MSSKKMKKSRVWIKNNTARRGFVNDLTLHFSFHCRPNQRAGDQQQDDQMKAGKTQLWGSEDKARSLQCHSLNPDIRGKGTRGVASSSWMAFWGYGRDYANHCCIVLSKVFPYQAFYLGKKRCPTSQLSNRQHFLCAFCVINTSTRPFHLYCLSLGPSEGVHRGAALTLCLWPGSPSLCLELHAIC